MAKFVIKKKTEDIKSFAKRMLDEETKGIKDYQAMLKVAKGDQKKMLQDIIDDELDHIEDLKELISGEIETDEEDEVEQE